MTAFWRRKGFAVLKSNEVNEEIQSGIGFNVCCIASTSIDDEAPCLDKIMTEFLGHAGNFCTEKDPSGSQLIVDLTGEIFYDQNGQVLLGFKMHDIRDVIYNESSAEFSNYLVVIGKEESNVTLQAYAFFSKNKENVIRLHGTFS